MLTLLFTESSTFLASTVFFSTDCVSVFFTSGIVVFTGSLIDSPVVDIPTCLFELSVVFRVAEPYTDE